MKHPKMYEHPQVEMGIILFWVILIGILAPWTLLFTIPLSATRMETLYDKTNGNDPYAERKPRDTSEDYNNNAIDDDDEEDY